MLLEEIERPRSAFRLLEREEVRGLGHKAMVDRYKFAEDLENGWQDTIP